MAEIIAQEFNVTMALKELKCVKFSLSQFASENKSRIDFESYRYEFTANTRVDSDKQSIIVLFIAKLFDKVGDDRNLISEIETETFFHIQNFFDIVRIDNNTYLLPDQIIGITAVIALSNTRGMLSLKLEGTPYSNSLIPLMDASQFMPAK